MQKLFWGKKLSPAQKTLTERAKSNLVQPSASPDTWNLALDVRSWLLLLLAYHTAWIIKLNCFNDFVLHFTSLMQLKLGCFVRSERQAVKVKHLSQPLSALSYNKAGKLRRGSIQYHQHWHSKVWSQAWPQGTKHSIFWAFCMGAREPNLRDWSKGVNPYRNLQGLGPLFTLENRRLWKDFSPSFRPSST